jgi:type VI secretion system protein ImpH
MTGDPENAAAAPDDGVDAAPAQAMAPAGRMRNVEALLRARGGSFGLFQAIRLLELRDSRRTPPGAFADPSGEVVRLSQNPSLASAAREVEELELADEGPDRLTTNVFGLVGAMGVLPHPYSTVVLERARARDRTARDFLDIFQHRFISLLYAAWRKGKPELALERGDDDEHLHHLLDLMGMGHEPDEAFPGVDPETLGWYMGLLAVPTRSAPALEQLLGDRFGVGVRVEPFVGGWLRLDPTDHCRLGEETEADVLGGGAVVGDEVWDPHARIRVRMGPLSRAAFDRLLPGSEDHDALRRLVRFFTHDAFDVELQLVLRHDEVAGTTLAAHSNASSPLGWGTWLASRPRAEDGDETTFKL